MSVQRDHVTPPVTYQGLFEKYARREQHRAVFALANTVMAVVGAVGAVLALRELRKDRAAVQAISGRSHP
jgi:hypothetical protein